MNLSCTQGQNQTLYEGVSHLTAQPGSGTIQLNLDHGNIITTSSNVVGDEMGGIDILNHFCRFEAARIIARFYFFYCAVK